MNRQRYFYRLRSTNSSGRRRRDIIIYRPSARLPFGQDACRSVKPILSFTSEIVSATDDTNTDTGRPRPSDAIPYKNYAFTCICIYIYLRRVVKLSCLENKRVSIVFTGRSFDVSAAAIPSARNYVTRVPSTSRNGIPTFLPHGSRDRPPIVPSERRRRRFAPTVGEGKSVSPNSSPPTDGVNYPSSCLRDEGRGDNCSFNHSRRTYGVHTLGSGRGEA